MKICRLCKIEKSLEEYKVRTDTGKHRSECRECCNLIYKRLNKAREDRQKEYSKRYYQENKDSIKAATKENRKARPEAYREYKRKYQVERRKKDPLFALKSRIRHRLKEALKYKSWKKTTKFNDYIGCSCDEFKAHIESQFAPGMSWENRAEWHLDHIMPLDYASSIEEFYELNHYLNLRPLWAGDNCSKNNEVTDEGHAILAKIREIKTQSSRGV